MPTLEEIVYDYDALKDLDLTEGIAQICIRLDRTMPNAEGQQAAYEAINFVNDAIEVAAKGIEEAGAPELANEIRGLKVVI